MDNYVTFIPPMKPYFDPIYFFSYLSKFVLLVLSSIHSVVGAIARVILVAPFPPYHASVGRAFNSPEDFYAPPPNQPPTPCWPYTANIVRLDPLSPL